ncbi:MAG: hypothetical protein HYV29_08015 [Ignavibacteriales bacterium]|nr:hypothetical protein [Ignavibacteriales bacterium]
MKKTFFFFFLTTVTLAQNPDGKNASLHLSPSWLWGKSDYQRVTSMWYPPTQASDPQTVQTTDLGIVDHPFAFGINTMIKIPTTSNLTFSLSYSFNQYFQEYGTSNEKKPYFSQFWSLNGRLHTVSATVSVYDLFSIYQE